MLDYVIRLIHGDAIVSIDEERHLNLAAKFHKKSFLLAVAVANVAADVVKVQFRQLGTHFLTIWTTFFLIIRVESLYYFNLVDCPVLFYLNCSGNFPNTMFLTATAASLARLTSSPAGQKSSS